MANTKSAAKNARKAVKRHEARVSIKSELRTLRKKTLEAAAKPKTPAATVNTLLREACSKLEKAASNKYIARRTASRRVGRLMRAVHKLQAAQAQD